MTFVKFINSITSYLVPAVSRGLSSAFNPLHPCELSTEGSVLGSESSRAALPLQGPAQGLSSLPSPCCSPPHVLASPPPWASPCRGTRADKALELSGARWPHLESCALPHLDELWGMGMGFPSVSWPWGERKAAKIGLSRAVLPCSAGLSRAGRM